MKNLFTLLLVVSLFSCKKDLRSLEEDRSNYLEQVDTYLKANMLPDDYARISLEKSVIDTAVSEQMLFTRIPFKNKSSNTDFILLKTNFSGACSSARIINLPKEFYTVFPFVGTIKTNTLIGNDPQQIVVGNNTSANSQNVLPASTSPAATVTAYISTGSNYYFLNWLAADAVLFVNNGNSTFPNSGTSNENGNTFFGNYINPGGGGGGSSTQEVQNTYYTSVSGEDINKIFNCFNTIPDVGASYSMKICADVPNNNSPQVSIDNWHPGHAFLIITKTNGSQSVTKSFGFYPTTGPKSLFLSPVTSKIINDFNHEINASLEMKNLTQANFNTIKAKAITLASSKYDLDEFNCEDYAISVFNCVRTNNPLVLEPFTQIMLSLSPGAPPTTLVIKNSPNMLYKKISAILEDSTIEWRNAKLNLTHSYRSPNTTGGCN